MLASGENMQIISRVEKVAKHGTEQYTPDIDVALNL
jgi:hypothetical protein